MQFSNSEPVFTLTSRKTLDCTKVTTGFQTNIQNEFKKYVRTQGFQRNIHSNVNKYVPRGLKEIFKYIFNKYAPQGKFFSIFVWGGARYGILRTTECFFGFKKVFLPFLLISSLCKGSSSKKATQHILQTMLPSSMIPENQQNGFRNVFNKIAILRVKVLKRKSQFIVLLQKTS